MRHNLESNSLGNNKMHAHNHSIKCNVDTCYYNNNHFCSANVIEVNPLGDGHAETSDGTSCTTFVPDSTR